MAGKTPRDFPEWMRKVDRQLEAASRNSARAVQGVREVKDEVGEVVLPGIPAAPVEITTQSAIYKSESGAWRGRIDVEFPDVVFTVDQKPIKVAGYEMYGYEEALFPEGTPIVWQQYGGSDISSITRMDLPTNRWYIMKVRAINGEWSTPFRVQTAKDTTPPPQPTAPTAKVFLGSITVKWDGKAVTGDMPADTEAVILCVGTDPSPGLTKEVTRFAPDDRIFVLTELAYYKPVFIRLIAVDHSGNYSPWSEQVTAFIKPLVDADIILGEIDAGKTIIKNAEKVVLSTGAELGANLSATATTLAATEKRLTGPGGLTERLGGAERLLADVGSLTYAAGQTLRQKLAASDQSISTAQGQLDTVRNTTLPKLVQDLGVAEGRITAADTQISNAFTQLTQVEAAARATNDLIAQAIASGQSLIVNGGFEAGMTGWQENAGGVVLAAAARSGTGGMRLTPAGKNVWPKNQEIATSTGRTYYAEMWVRRTGADTWSTQGIGFVVQTKLASGAWGTAVVFRPAPVDGVALTAGDIPTDRFVKVAAEVTLTQVDVNRASFAPWFYQSENVYDIDDMLVIDVTEAKKVQAGLTAAETDIANAKKEITTNKGVMDSAITRLGVSEKEVTAAKDRLTIAEGKVATLQNTTLPGLTSDLSAANGRLTAAEGKITKAEGTLSTATSDLSKLTNRVSPLESGINTLNNTTIPGLQTSIDGKTEIIRKTVAPTTADSAAPGTRWEVWTTLSPGGKLMQTWRRTATTNAWIQDLLSADYLPLVDIGAGTFGSLSGGRLTAKSVSAAQMLIGFGENLLADPTFEDPEISARRASGAANWSWVQDPLGGSYMTTEWATTADLPLGNSSNAELFPIDPTGAMAFTVDAEGPDVLQVYLQVRYADGTSNTGPYVKSLPLGAGAGRRTATVQYDFAGASLSGTGSPPVSARPILRRKTSALTGVTKVFSVRFAPATKGEMVVNGTITGDHVAAESVAAKIGSFLSLTTDQLVAGSAVLGDAVAQKIAAATASFQKVDAKNLTVTGTSSLSEVVAKRLAAETGVFLSLTTDQLTAGSGNINNLVAQKIAAGTAAFQKADISNLTAGTANMTQAVIDKLVANTAKFQTVTVDNITATATANLNSVVAQRIAAGTATFQTVDVKNLFVTGTASMNEVVAKRIAAETGEFIKLSVDQLTVAGTANMATAVADKMFANIFATNRLTASQILIGEGGNIFADPNFVDPTGWNNPTWIVAGGGRNGNNGLAIPASTSQSGAYYGLSDRNRQFAVIPGASYKISAWVKPDGAVPVGGASIYMKYTTPAGAVSGLFGTPGNVSNTEPLVAGVWAEIAGVIKLPNTATKAFLGVFTQTSTNVRVVFSEPGGVQAVDQGLIVDNGILARHITASEEMSAKIGTFMKLNVDQLVATGTSSLNTAVIESLWTNVVRSRSITTDMLTVGSGPNAIVDPFFESAEIKAIRKSRTAGWGGWSRNSTLNLNWYGASGLAGTSNSFYFDSASTSEPGTMIAVEEGQKWRFKAKYNATTNGPRATARIIYKDGSTAYSASWWTTDTGGSNGYGPTGVQDFDRIFTVPENVAYITPALQFPTDTTAAYVYGGASLVNMATSAVIVDGAITTKKLTITEEMTAALLKAKKVEAIEIDANSLRADVGFIGILRAGILVTDVVTSTHIKSDSITTDLLKSDAITAKHVLTGPLIRSAASGARTEMTNQGIRVLNASNIELVRLGYGISTGMSVRNPVSGTLVPLANMVFGTQVIQGYANANYVTNKITPAKGTMTFEVIAEGNVPTTPTRVWMTAQTDTHVVNFQMAMGAWTNSSFVKPETLEGRAGMCTIGVQIFPESGTIPSNYLGNISGTVGYNLTYKSYLSGMFMATGLVPGRRYRFVVLITNLDTDSPLISSNYTPDQITILSLPM